MEDEPLDLLGTSFGDSAVPSSSRAAARNDPVDAQVENGMVPEPSPPSGVQRPHETPIAPDESVGVEVAASPFWMAYI